MHRATLRQMQIFATVARHLSFSRAAQELHLTQPAVSLQVKQLEGLVLLPLFEQVGRRIFLTDTGENLLRYVKRILDEIANAETSMALRRGEDSGLLKIAVVSTAKYFAPYIISQFTKQRPGVELSLSVANREQILELLADNKVDLAIMGKPPENPPLKAFEFAQHPSVFIAPPGHPLASKPIQLADLRGETLLVREKGSGTRILMEHFLEQANEKPMRIIELSSNETIKQSVMAGMGISFISEHTIGLEVSCSRLTILNVKNTPVLRQWYLVHREGKLLLPVVQAFVDHVCELGDKATIKARQHQATKPNHKL